MTAHRAFWPAVAGLLGLAISLIAITTPSIWYDEAATITAATRSWPQLVAMLGTVDAVHALYYFIIHGVFDVVGYSPLALRLPSAIAVGITAALVVVLGRQLGRPRLAIIAGIAFCLLPRVTWMGTEGRSYAMTALVAVLLTVVFVKAQASVQKRWWILYSAVALLACILFLYLALIVAAHAVSLLLRVVLRDGVTRRSVIGWALAAGAAGLIALPFVREVISQSAQVSWIEPLGVDTVRQVFRTQWFHYSFPFAIAAWLLIAVGLVAAIVGRRRFELVTILPLLVVPTLALLLMSELVSPVYQPRYLTMGTPFAALAVAMGIDAFRPRLAAIAAVLVLAVLAVPQVIEQRQPAAKELSSWSAVADLIAADRADDPGSETGIIYGTVQRHRSATARVIEYAYPDAFDGTVDITLRTSAADSGRLWEYTNPIADSTDRLRGLDTVYLITGRTRDQRPETIRVMRLAGWEVTERWDFPSVHVLRFERETSGPN